MEDRQIPAGIIDFYFSLYAMSKLRAVRLANLGSAFKIRLSKSVLNILAVSINLKRFDVSTQPCLDSDGEVKADQPQQSLGESSGVCGEVDLFLGMKLKIKSLGS